MSFEDEKEQSIEIISKCFSFSTATKDEKKVLQMEFRKMMSDDYGISVDNDNTAILFALVALCSYITGTDPTREKIDFLLLELTKEYMK